jgi:hypothetical protein
MEDQAIPEATGVSNDFEIAGLHMKKEAAMAWVFRLLLLVALLYANSTYVSKSDYARDMEKSDARREAILQTLSTVSETLTRIDEKMKNDGRQDSRLEDHEIRIRKLEQFHDGKP